MRTIQHQDKLTQMVLEPGEHYASDQKIMISTLLGSCVSACLYDPVNQIVGMNHFLLSTQKHPKSASVVISDEGRYGIHAMELIINQMISLGASRQHMKAKAFGGGNVLQTNGNETTIFDIGELNKAFILEFLKKENIPLVSSDLGGHQGRVIRFYSTDYAVYVRKIRRLDTKLVLARDTQYYKKRISETKAKKVDIELWNPK